MKKLTLIILSIISVQSCNINKNNKYLVEYNDYSIKVDSANVPLDSNQLYLPLKVFTDTSIYIGRDTFLVKWYSLHLAAMREPLLFNKKTTKEIYRFLWLRTFHNPISIRIEKDNDKYTLTWKLCNGRGGYSPGKTIINETKSINEKIWVEFNKKLKRARYWSLKTNEKKINGEDGAQWILEGISNNRYQVVDRWSPFDGDFYACCNYLIDLTDLVINKNDKY